MNVVEAPDMKALAAEVITALRGVLPEAYVCVVVIHDADRNLTMLCGNVDDETQAKLLRYGVEQAEDGGSELIPEH